MINLFNYFSRINFFIIDLILFAGFLIFIILFLFKNRKKVSREGIFLLYRTNLGIKIIDSFAKKNKKMLNFLSYFSIIFGYLFMFISIFLLIWYSLLMLSARIVPKTPPLLPIIPYIGEIFKISFLPPLYFTYWIIIILIVAISHEFAHGIFARLYGIKIKSTGFGFLGPFIAAFVEPDEKLMKKKRIKNQLAILSAGSFSNFLVGIIFIIFIQLFFTLFYVPVGITGYTYAISQVSLSNISTFNNLSLSDFLKTNNSNLSFPIEVKTKYNKTYFLDKNLWEIQESLIKKNKTNNIYLYLDTPAFKNNLTGAIIEIDDKKINSIKDIQIALKDKKPGEKIKIKTEYKLYEINLSKHPQNSSKGFLGISYAKPSLIAYLFSFSFPKFNPYLKVKPRFDSEIFDFIKDLIYWLILISISVALFNMLPFSFLDGGRVSYLTFLKIFKNKNKALKLYSFFNILIILILLLMFIIWMLKI